MGRGTGKGGGITSVNFIPRIMPSQGRTRTLTAVAKKRLKLAGVKDSCNSGQYESQNG